MELPKAQEIQRVRAEHLAALAALLLGNAPEAETNATVAYRYGRLAARLDETAQFHHVNGREGYEVTPAYVVAAGAEPLPGVRLRFVRQPSSTGAGVPATIMAEWLHSPEDASSVVDSGPVFTNLAYGEVFAVEHVDKTEAVAATEGEPFPPMHGADPRPVAARMTLLEQSFEVFEAALPGSILSGPGNPQ